MIFYQSIKKIANRNKTWSRKKSSFLFVFSVFLSSLKYFVSCFNWFMVDMIGHFFLDFGVEDFWNFDILKFVHVLNSHNAFRVGLFKLEAKHGWNELFFLKEGSQIRVSHQEQVRETGAKEGSINIGEFLLGVVNISASWTVNFNSREFAISTHADWDYVLVFTHDSGTVAKLSCQVSLSH